MALLQIREPDTASAAKVAVGIDLGTTNSLVAFRQADGTTRLIEDANGKAIIPSVVAIGEQGQVCVGNPAAAKMTDAGWHTFSSIKRYMGLTAEEIARCPYQLDASKTPPRFVTGKKSLTAQEISALVLQHLIRMTELAEGKIGTAVVTVPAYFDDAQRKATQDAANIAGLPLVRLLNEPTAAALAYGLERKQDGYIAVFDLGGGTFDISILKCSDRLLKVVATSGDTALGGDDFDARLLGVALQKAGCQTEQLTNPQYRALMLKAREVKQTLSHQPRAIFDLSLLSAETLVTVTAEEFAHASQDLVSRCCTLTLDAIHEANLEAKDIDSLILVGGSTRMPHIKHHLRDVLAETDIYDALDPDTTVAVGAAHLAAVLAGQQSETTLVDVIPLSLGIETMGGLMEKIIPRNTPIPVVREQHFTTARDGQRQFLLHVLQGERELVSDCRSLARFVLKDIPPMSAGAARLRVCFAVNASGVLSVTAMEENSGVSQKVEVQSTAGLDEKAIARLLKASHTHAGKDAAARIWRETMVEADQLVAATRKAMDQDGHLLEQGEQYSIAAALAQVEKVRHSQDSDVLRAANQQLVEATTPFAHKRMEQVLKKSLQNRPIDTLGTPD